MSEELHRKGFWFRVKHFIRANLLAGILFLTPIMATFYFLHIFFNWADGLLQIIPDRYQPANFLPFPIPGLGLIMLFGVLLLTGFLVRNYLGRKLVHIWERIIDSIPMVNKLYQAIKQLVETIFKHSPKDFKRVVLIEFPRKGIYAIAFMTGEAIGETHVAIGETQKKTDKKVIHVFMPTTPNPTSGYFLMIPEDSVIPLEMSVEDGFKLVISGGILNPDSKKNTQGGSK